MGSAPSLSCTMQRTLTRRPRGPRRVVRIAEHNAAGLHLKVSKAEKHDNAAGRCCMFLRRLVYRRKTCHTSSQV